MLHWATAAVWTLPPKIQYKPVWVRLLLVFVVEFQDLDVPLFSCIGHFHPFWLVHQVIILADLCVCHCPLLLWGMSWPNDLFQSCFSESRLFQNSVKLGDWGEEGNCLLPKQMDIKRSLDISAERKARQRQGIQFLRNKGSLAEELMLLLCVCRDVLHWVLFCWEGIWDVQGEGMLLIA